MGTKAIGYKDGAEQFESKGEDRNSEFSSLEPESGLRNCACF
jgi:hypothetical protein